MAPVYKASGLHIYYNYNTATIWLFHLIVEYRLPALTIMGRIVPINKQKQLKIWIFIILILIYHVTLC